MNHFDKGLVAAFLLAAFLVMPTAGSAQQTSVDSRIVEAFEEIDERTAAHEIDASALRVSLEDRRGNA